MTSPDMMKYAARAKAKSRSTNTALVSARFRSGSASINLVRSHFGRSLLHAVIGEFGRSGFAAHRIGLSLFAPRN